MTGTARGLELAGRRCAKIGSRTAADEYFDVTGKTEASTPPELD